MSLSASALYQPGLSWLHRLDARVKLWLAFLLILWVVLRPRTEVVGAVLVVGLFAALTAGIESRTLLKAGRTLLPLMIIIIVLQPLIAPGDGPAFFAWWIVRLTWEGVNAGIRIALTVAAAALIIQLPLWTTTMTQIIRALERLGLPANLALIISLAMQTVGSLGGMYASIEAAQQARGWDLSERRNWQRAKAAIPTLVAVIVAALRLSDSLGLALAARGFGAEVAHQTRLYDLQMRRLDWIVLGLFTVLIGLGILSTG